MPTVNAWVKILAPNSCGREDMGRLRFKVNLAETLFPKHFDMFQQLQVAHRDCWTVAFTVGFWPPAQLPRQAISKGEAMTSEVAFVASAGGFAVPTFQVSDVRDFLFGPWEISIAS